MKKISIIILGVAGLLMTSCDDNKKEPAYPQVNPQNPIVDVKDVTLAETGVLTAGSVFNMNNYELTDSVAVIQLTEVQNLPDGAEVNLKFELSADADFSHVQTLNVVHGESDVNMYYVLVADWNDAHYNLFGKNQNEHTAYFRVPAFITLGGSDYRLGGNDHYAFTGSLKEICIKAEGLDMDYLYTPGGANGWSFDDNMLLKNIGDYVTYRGFVNVQNEFKITGQPSWDGLEWGVNPDVEGGLIEHGGNIQATDGNGLYWVSTNMEDMTYAMTFINSISMIGDFNSWGGDEELTPSDDYKVWTGSLTLTDAGGWKFRINNDWAINFGGNPDDLLFDGGNFTSEAGTYTVTLYIGSWPYHCTIVAQ